jgi:hypothetical protein
MNASRPGVAKANRLNKVTHGQTVSKRPTKEYTLWANIVQRCTNANCRDYPYYGGRGITMHPPWRADFLAFITDVGRAPSAAHTLDRMDNDGPYAPGNVRWATRLEQNNNTRVVTYIEHEGMRKTIIEWAAHLGLPANLLRSRVPKYGKTAAILGPRKR